MMRPRYAAAETTVVTGGRRFGMTIARPNTFAVAPTTAESAAPSRRCRCQSSGRASVTREGVTAEDMESTYGGDYKDAARSNRTFARVPGQNWRVGAEERYNRLFRAARPAFTQRDVRQQEFEEQEPKHGRQD